MMIYTGMRISELFNPRVENVHETYVIGGEKTKAGRNRIIPIHSKGRGFFAEFKQRTTNEFLISGYSGQKIAANFRKREYCPLLERLDISKKTPHTARHAFASWAVANNIKPELLQKMLGHADYSTTANIYEHFDTDQLIDAIDVPVTNALLTNQKTAESKRLLMTSSALLDFPTYHDLKRDCKNVLHGIPCDRLCCYEKQHSVSAHGA